MKTGRKGWNLKTVRRNYIIIIMRKTLTTVDVVISSRDLSKLDEVFNADAQDTELWLCPFFSRTKEAILAFRARIHSPQESEQVRTIAPNIIRSSVTSRRQQGGRKPKTDAKSFEKDSDYVLSWARRSTNDLITNDDKIMSTRWCLLVWSIWGLG